MKKFILLGMLSPLTILSQVLNTQPAINGGAERHLQFKVSDAPNDVMEIGNNTSQNNQFQPDIWAHKESSNGPVMIFAGHITSAVDYGTTPILNFVAAKGIFDNNAPYSSQFPWGNGGTATLIENRPIFAVSNAYNRVFTIAANGNVGIGTLDPLAKLHTVGTVRFENLPALNKGCFLKINYLTGELGVDQTTCSRMGKITDDQKLPIIDALKTISKIETYEFIDDRQNLSSGFDAEKTELINADYQALIPYLLESIKELKAKVDDLENKLNAKNNLGEGHNNLAIKVYPNPVKDILSIYFEKADHSANQIKIYDASGKILLEKSAVPSDKKVSINVSNFPTGAYFYEVINRNEKQISQGKFLKE